MSESHPDPWVTGKPSPWQARLRVLLIAMKGFGLAGQTLTGLIALNGAGEAAFERRAR